MDSSFQNITIGIVLFVIAWILYVIFFGIKAPASTYEQKYQEIMQGDQYKVKGKYE